MSALLFVEWICCLMLLKGIYECLAVPSQLGMQPYPEQFWWVVAKWLKVGPNGIVDYP